TSPSTSPETRPTASDSPATSLRVIVCLGGFAWQALWLPLAAAGFAVPRPRPAFGHGAEVVLTRRAQGSVLLIGCYHPSQQNTFPGRGTRAMWDAISTGARRECEISET